jgi:hypothetical protein
MMITYHPHMKNIHNFKIVVLEILKNSKYNFRMFKFQDSFARCKRVIINVFFQILQVGALARILNIN